MEIEYTTRIHKERDVYIAHATELDVSSAGDTIDDARARLREAVGLFVEEAARMGTLGQILDEAGYVDTGGHWRPPQVLSSEPSRVTVPVGAA